MDRQALLVRYQVMSATRLHFSQLYFLVVAFSVAMSATILLSIHQIAEISASFIFGICALIMASSCFISNRLFLRERASFDEMQKTWRELMAKSMVEDGNRKNPLAATGAMSIITVGQAVVAICLFAMAVMNN